MPPRNHGGLCHALLATVYFLAAPTLTLAHTKDAGGLPGHDGMVDETPIHNATDYPISYFAYANHSSTIYAHIAFMVLAWVFVLPIAVMLSIAKSRHTFAVQLIFLAVNILGVVLSMVYNASTPDLYPNNAHHKIGWIITWIFSAHVFVNVAGRIAKPRAQPVSSAKYQIIYPLPSTALQQSTPYAPDIYHGQESRESGDSGHGTASPSSSVRGGSSQCDDSKEYGGNNDDFENLPLSSADLPDTTLMAKVKRAASRNIWKCLELGYKVVDRIILLFGFVTFTTGIITFARFFEGHAVFGGLAHWIKGGVFFWLGLFNLGRWSGSFAELGWAWNLRPRACSRKFRPSAEFVESSLILFYGSTNIFLEHLGGWGGAWTAQDLEHMAITVLFIGGGLCGMLIESTRIRDLLNTTMSVVPTRSYSSEEQEHLEPPETYEFSLNPIPALVILLLGIMMSSHHQSTMTASMVHKQWGTLLLWASVARGLTYVLFYLRPPRSVFPSRPPTELLASFGLIAGGIIFMASSADTVNGMIHYDLDAMFLYTVTMGMVGMLMAWEIAVLAIKGWAVRRELTLGGPAL